MTVRNIILFLTDDLGWGDLGCFGHPHIQTPNLDAFARRGLLLTDCHAASAVCSPSRAGLLTGRTPYRNGMYSIHLDDRPTPFLRREEVTLPRLLKQHGYATCHVGKWHLGSLGEEDGHPTPADHGYDHWLATQSAAKPSHLNPVNFIRNGAACGRIEGNSSGILATEAIDWLEHRKPEDAPFYMSFWTHEPHTPIGTESRFRDLYPTDLPQKKRDYFGNVSQLDDAFGRLIQYLDQRGLMEETLVFFTSDNGPAWDPDFINLGSTGGHRGAKAWLYEGGIRVPGLLHWPGRTQPQTVSHATINGTDFFPSVLDELGIALPDDRVIDGVSILPILEGRAVQRHQPLYWRYDGADGDLKIAYREEDCVLLADASIDRCEMFDLAADWQQRDNLVYREFDRFAAMKRRLLDVHRAVEEDGPDWWRSDPDPLMGWKQSHPEGITRHLQAGPPPEAPPPYPPQNMRGRATTTRSPAGIRSTE